MNSTHVQCPGLVTSPNSELAGPGALRQALNVVLRRAGLIEKRRPVRQYTRTTSFTTSARPNAIFSYNKHLYVIDNATPSRWYMDDGTNTGTLTPLTPLPTSVSNVAFGQYTTAELNGNLYIPFAGQLLKIDSLGTPPYLAGLPAPAYITCATANTGAVWLPNGSIVAYRVVFGFTDANGQLVLSAPSNRYLITNSSGSTATVNVTIAAPAEVSLSAKQSTIFVQIYRTATVTTGDPGDEMGLVYQAQGAPASVMTVTDIFPDGVNKGPALYTNASQQGIANANTQPPLCQDIAAFKGAMFYANTVSKQRINTIVVGIPEFTISSIQANTPIAGQSTFNFSGSPDLSGILVGDALNVNGSTGAANDGVSTIVSVDNSLKKIVNSNPGVAQAGAAGVAFCGTETTIGPGGTFSTGYTYGPNVGNIPLLSAGTFAQRLALFGRTVANSASGFGALGYVIAGPDDAPGTVSWVEDGEMAIPPRWPNIGGAPFTLNFRGGAFKSCFAPVVPASGMVSRSDASVSRVYYSKFQQPEHVPLANFFDIAGKTAAILRIVPLRDSLFVFKEDGVYRITGDGINWNVARFDDTIILTHKNAVQAIYNTIYAITNKGCVAITDNGVRIASEPIANKIRSFTDGSAAPVCYSHASEKDGLVYFVLTQGAASMGICFSYKTNTWSEIDLTPQGSGAVQLMGGPGIQIGSTAYRMNTDQVYAEAVVDPTENPALGTIVAGCPVQSDRYVLTISAVNPGAQQITATLNTTAHTLAVGDLVMENVGSIANTGLWQITAVNGATLTLSSTGTNAIVTQAGFQFAAGTTYLYAPMPCVVEYQPFTAGDDHSVSRFPAASVLLDSASTADTAQIGFFTEIARTEIDQQTLAFAAGTNIFDLRALVPLTMNRCRRLSMVFRHQEPGHIVLIKGVSYEHTEYNDARVIE